MTVDELFEKHEDEHGKFERIPEAERLHPLQDVCALIYLHRKFGHTYKGIAAAEHDEICLEGDPEKLTEDDVIYLARCSVRYGDDSLWMFV